tara:strand:+ start:2002 stop:3087 length:1086 start_codon:yes stop_codon:yes gene_type:complete
MLLYNRYFAIQYLKSILLIFFIALALIFLIDISEISRRLADVGDISLINIIILSIYKLPSTFEEISPVVILFGTLLFLNRLSRHSELIISNASGLSFWQVITPPAVISVLFGLFMILVVDPLGIQYKDNFSILERDIKGQNKLINLENKKEFWSAQKNSSGELIVNADQVYLNQLTLIDATFLQFDNNKNIKEKYDSAYAKFEANQWLLYNVWVDKEGKSREYFETYKVDTESSELLMFENAIKNSNQSIWTIFGVIKKLNLNGISPTKQIVDLNFLIAMPALMLALVLTAACFCIKLFRVQHSIFMIILGVIVGLLLFFVNHISYILSENEIFNPILGAWWHIITAILIASKVLISKEDG